MPIPLRQTDSRTHRRLRSLKHKYGPSLAAVLAYGEELERSNQTAELDQQIDRVRAQLVEQTSSTLPSGARAIGRTQTRGRCVRTAIARSLKDQAYRTRPFSVQLIPAQRQQMNVVRTSHVLYKYKLRAVNCVLWHA